MSELSSLGERIRNRSASLPLQAVVAQTFLALFLLLFLTELDRELVRRDWLPVPGGGIVVYCGGMVGVVICLAVAAGRARADLLGQVVAILRHHWLFALVFLALLLLSLGYWFRQPAAKLRDALLIVSPSIVCIGAALLPLISRVRRGWRAYLGLAFVVYCLSIWMDVWQPGTFSTIEGRAAGLAVDTNTGAYMVALLAVPLLHYRQFSLVSLIVLYLAGLTIFLTLSRGGALSCLLVAGCYLSLIFAKSPSRRVFVSLAFGAMAVLLVFFAWLSVRSFDHFSAPETQTRLRLFLGKANWFQTRLKASNKAVIVPILERYNNRFGRVVPKEGQNNTSDRTYFRTDGEYVYVETARMTRLKNAFEAIAASPIVGHGTGFNSHGAISAHNMYLALWIDFGLLGFLLYIAFLTAGFSGFYRLKYWPGMFLIGFVACWSMFSHTVFASRPLFVVLGLLLSLPLMTSRHRDAA